MRVQVIRYANGDVLGVRSAATRKTIARAVEDGVADMIAADAAGDTPRGWDAFKRGAALAKSIRDGASTRAELEQFGRTPFDCLKAGDSLFVRLCYDEPARGVIKIVRVD